MENEITVMYEIERREIVLDCLQKKNNIITISIDE